MSRGHLWCYHHYMSTKREEKLVTCKPYYINIVYVISVDCINRLGFCFCVFLLAFVLL